MKIINFPKFENHLECPVCSCLFEFDRGDIRLQEEVVKHEFLGSYDIEYVAYIPCPICGFKHMVNFRRNSNGKD